jgi:histidinol-phosphate aminotransferase
MLLLNYNENRLGLPDSVRAAVLESLGDAHLYPEVSGPRIRAALGARHGLPPAGVLPCHGSTEVLRMVVPMHAEGRYPISVLTADPTFEQLADYANAHGATVHTVPITPGEGAHDIPRMQALSRSLSDPLIIYICNPNNPTGTVTDVSEVRAWIREAPEHHLFVVDEAYLEFVLDPRYESLDQEAWARPNVVVLRTFSKVYAMAGLRLGYAIAHPDTIRKMRPFLTGRGATHVSNLAGLAALNDPGFLRRTQEMARDSRAIVLETLGDLGLSHLPSHANFVMHEVNGPVEVYVERMAEAGISVGRPFPPFLTHNRVSLGLPHEMAQWADVIRGFRKRGWV